MDARTAKEKLMEAVRETSPLQTHRQYLGMSQILAAIDRQEPPRCECGRCNGTMTRAIPDPARVARLLNLVRSRG